LSAFKLSAFAGKMLCTLPDIVPFSKLCGEGAKPKNMVEMAEYQVYEYNRDNLQPRMTVRHTFVWRQQQQQQLGSRSLAAACLYEALISAMCMMSQLFADYRGSSRMLHVYSKQHFFADMKAVAR
jgi:hypothetical protein